MSLQQSQNGAREASSPAPSAFLRLVLGLLLCALVLPACRAPEARAAHGEARLERKLKKGRIVPPGETAVTEVRITGAPNAHMKNELVEGISTRASSSFLWTKRYRLFDATELEKDLERIERAMRRRGYYEAKVRAARVIREPEKGNEPSKVRVEIEVTQGEPVVIRRLETEGLADLPFDAAQSAVTANPLRVGQLFDEDTFEAAKTEVRNALADRGYAHADVDGRATVDIAAHHAAVTLVAQPGPRAVLGAISVVGLSRLSERAVRRVLHLQRGALYSRTAIKSARSALIELGVFARVELIPDLSDTKSREVPLLVRVEEAPLRDVTLGVGGRLDLLRLAGVAHGSWTHRNFLGGLRKLTVSTRPGLTLFPTRFPTNIDQFQAPSNVFAENFATVRLEQPAFIESRTRGFVETGYNIYPLLYPLPENTDTRNERVIGYHEVTASLGASRNFFGRLLGLRLSLNWQANFPFTYQGTAENADLIDVHVTYPELITSIDLRDDPLQPTRGLYFSNSLQVAVPVIRGEPFDVRVHPELRTFIPLDRRRRVVLASRFGVGMVFPQNYGDALTHADDSAALDLANQDFIHDQQRLLFRAFYSGGPGSNRGYPYRRVGPQGAIAFLIPSTETCFQDGSGGSAPVLRDTCIRPLGGFTLWEASTELRFRAFDKWSFVAFVDASDVSTQVARFTFVEPHISIGPGIRYLSPVGPIRVDIGYRVPGLQKLGVVSGEPPDVSEVAPYNDPGGAPYDDQDWYDRFSLLILIGEDF